MGRHAVPVAGCRADPAGRHRNAAAVVPRGLYRCPSADRARVGADAHPHRPVPLPFQQQHALHRPGGGRGRGAVRPLVTTVLRSADAFFLVEGLRRSDSYSYSHAISCSALAAAFGRHMGFDEETIFSLAAGGLLMDVGKTRLPEELLQYQGSLAPSEVDVIRSHVALGLTVLEEAGIANLDVLDIVRTHHERHDGSGYP